jgi:hypothetical protein
MKASVHFKNNRRRYGGVESTFSVLTTSKTPRVESEGIAYERVSIHLQLNHFVPNENYKDQTGMLFEMQSATARALAKALLHVTGKTRGSQVRLLVEEAYQKKTRITKLPVRKRKALPSPNSN